jgi:hypothetical protein
MRETLEFILLISFIFGFIVFHGFCLRKALDKNIKDYWKRYIYALGASIFVLIGIYFISYSIVKFILNLIS